MVQQIKLYLQAPPCEIHCGCDDLFPVDHPTHAAVWRNLGLGALPDGEMAMVHRPLPVIGERDYGLLAA